MRNYRSTLVLILLLTGLLLGQNSPRKPDGQRSPSNQIDMVPRAPELFTGELTPPISLPFFDDFENGIGDWLSSGFFNLIETAEINKVLEPDINPELVTLSDQGYLPAATSGIGMWWYGEDSTGTFIGSDFHNASQSPKNGGRSTASNTGSLISPPLDLTALQGAVLRFQTWWEIEGVDVHSFDMMYVEISLDSGNTFSGIGRGNINPLKDANGESWKGFSSGGIGMPGVWLPQLFDLTPYVGNVAYLRFRFDTRDALYNGFRGWFIEDVLVEEMVGINPLIETVTPTISVPGGIITINGNNFANGAVVTMGATALSTTVISSESVMINVPSLASGTYDVTTTNPGGEFYTLTDGLTITTDQPPVVSGIFPDTTQFGITISVTVTGANFLAGATAEIGNFPLQELVVVDAGTITGTNPIELLIGNYNLTVINPDGQFDQLISAFTVIGSIISTDPAQLTFGEVALGDTATMQVLLTNNSDTAILIDSITILGADSAYFQTDTTSINLQPQDSLFVDVRFAPANVKNYSAVLLFASENGHASVNLYGVGYSSISAEPVQLNFGEVALGDTATMQVLLTNNSDTAILIDSIAILGADSAYFQVDTTSINLQPQDSLFVDVRFSADTVKDYSASLVLVSENGQASIEMIATIRALEAQNLIIGGDEDLHHLIGHTPTITFDYYDSKGEPQTHYHIQVSTDPAFSIVDVWDTGEIGSAETSIDWIAPTPLIDGTTYYLRLEVGSSGFWGGWAILEFHMNATSTSPMIIAPKNDEAVSSPILLSALNSLDAESDTLTYAFQVFGDVNLVTLLDSVSGVVEGADTTIWQINNVLPDNSRYWWTVTSYDGYEKSTTSDTVTFVFNSANDAPGAFSLLTPEDSTEVTSLTPLLDWDAALDPDLVDTVRYTIHLDTPEPGVYVIAVDTARSHQITLPLSDNTTYHWKVVARDLAGATTENTGGYYSFRVNTANDLPGDFALLSPPNEGMVTDLTPIFHWEVPVDPDGMANKNGERRTPSRSDVPGGSVISSISTYRFYISPDSTFSGVTPVDQDSNAYTPTVDLTEDLVYYWKVEAVDDVGGVKSSARWSFWTNSLNSPPLVFSVASPVDQAVVDNLRPGFIWHPSSDADLNDDLTYSLHLGNTVEALAVMYTGADTTFALATDLTDNTTYYWKVVARDLSGATTENTGGYFSFRVNTTNDLPGDFALISPAAGAMVVDPTPGFHWEVPTDPDDAAAGKFRNRISSGRVSREDPVVTSISTYRFYISPDSTFIGVTPVDLDTNTYTPAVDLSEDMVYYWKVEAEDDVGGVKSSARWSFWTNSQNSSPSAFSIASPVDQAVVDTLRPGIKWHPSSDADLNDELTYSLHLGSSFEELSVIYAGTDTAFTPTTDLTDNTTYYWKVIAHDLSGATRVSTGTAGYSSFSVNLGNEAPSPISLVSPDSVKVLDLSPQFYWTAATDPDPNDSIYYYFQFADFIAEPEDLIVILDMYIDTNSITFDGELADNSAYWWTVNSLDRLGSSTPTDTAIFWTDLFPESPGFFATVSPVMGAQGLAPNVEFEWRSSIDPDPLDLVNYSLGYATDWTDSITYTWMYGIVDTTVTISLDDNTEYLWIVEAKDSDGQVTVSNDGSIMRFVIGSLSIDDLAAIPEKYALHQNFPNPFNPKSTILYDLPDAVNVTLIVYDILGREVIRLVDQDMQPGYHQAVWDARNQVGRAVPTGIYIARLDTPGYTKSIKMVLLK